MLVAPDRASVKLVTDSLFESLKTGLDPVKKVDAIKRLQIGIRCYGSTDVELVGHDIPGSESPHKFWDMNGSIIFLLKTVEEPRRWVLS